MFYSMINFILKLRKKIPNKTMIIRAILEVLTDIYWLAFTLYRV